MNFTALAFVLGFPIVLAVHWLCPPCGRWLVLLTASLGFYALGSPQAVGILTVITLGTYGAALGIGRSRTVAGKDLWCAGGVLLCLGCLGWFKYAGFLGQTLAALLGREVPMWNILLPAGISFYTFQTLGYLLDVRRGTVPPERHLGHYALFVSFFPQLVAGPIERTGDLLPQLKQDQRTPDPQGAVLLLRGFAKKLLLADAMAPFVDRIYAAPGQGTGPEMLLATLLFAGQIYFDFSGYSDIAVGAAALLGVRLNRNFDHPYRAASIREFWRRWHVSLTRWFTDYLYIPLGGSRCGLVRHCVNLLVVFLASGLWHGAAWHFVLWGALHGAFLAAEVCCRKWFPQKALPRPAAHGLTLVLVCFAWVFFRADSVSAGGKLLAQLPTGWSLSTLADCGQAVGLLPAAQMALGGLCLKLLPERLTGDLREATALFWLTVAVFAAWMAGLTANTASAFLYFQF